MKILDNKKDFYDYLVGEYGIDDLTVFDRRKAVIIKANVKPEKHVDYLFSTVRGDKDIYQKEEYSYRIGKKVKIGTYYRFALKTGRHFYHFLVERYLIDDMNVCIKTQLINEEDNDFLYSDLALAILPYPNYQYYFSEKDYYRIEDKQRDVYKDQIIDLPILKDTVIPKYVLAKDVFLNIYSHLSSKKDIKVEDNRSDIMKLQSAGFDKIESFRNIK